MFISKPIEVPARSERVCYVSTNHSEAQLVMFEPCQAVQDKYKTPMACCIGRVSNGQIPISIANLQSSILTLRQDMKLGEVSEVEESELTKQIKGKE